MPLRSPFAAVAHALLRLVPQRTVVPILSGPLRGGRWIMHSATHGCWAGTYERETQELFVKHVRRGDVVFDIGANVGFFTLLAAKLVGPEGHVYAFEPLPRNIELLERHVDVNALKNVTVMPLALSRTPGTARFREAASPSMGGIAADGEIEVRVSSIDELLRSGDVPRPAFMKIDVEGAEHELLSGAADALATRPVILLSTHGYKQQDLCRELLAGHGYDFEVLRDGTVDGNYVDLAR